MNATNWKSTAGAIAVGVFGYFLAVRSTLEPGLFDGPCSGAWGFAWYCHARIFAVTFIAIGLLPLLFRLKRLALYSAGGFLMSLAGTEAYVLVVEERSKHFVSYLQMPSMFGVWSGLWFAVLSVAAVVVTVWLLTRHSTGPRARWRGRSAG